MEELPFTTRRPNVEVVQAQCWKNGRQSVHETFRTPIGEVTQTWVVEPGYGSPPRGVPHHAAARL